MLDFVNVLLDSKDNIMDQLLLLKKYKDNKEVNFYINYLLEINISPYMRYCILKYYFDKNPKEVVVDKKYSDVKLFKIYLPNIKELLEEY